MLSQPRGHFKRAARARPSRSPCPERAERTGFTESERVRGGAGERVRGAGTCGLGERAERDEPAACAKRDLRLTDRARERGLRAPAPVRVECQLERTIFALERRAHLD